MNTVPSAIIATAIVCFAISYAISHRYSIAAVTLPSALDEAPAAKNAAFVLDQWTGRVRWAYPPTGEILIPKNYVSP
jgi:hypothetical protein